MEGHGWRLLCGDCGSTQLCWLTKKGCYVCRHCNKTPRYITDQITGYKLSALVRHHYLQMLKEAGSVVMG